MNQSYQNLAIVIPSLDPTPSLIPYIDTLLAEGFLHIYVVNDGSSSVYDSVFTEIKERSECTVLVHTKNRGKGAALKSGFAYIKKHQLDCQGIITVDSDGQHAVKDVCHMAEALLEDKEGLLLGSRNFSQQGIPIKSRLGNRMSSLLFFAFYGKWVGDTQTGLRAFSMDMLPEMLAIDGERFAYEMAVLVACTQRKIPVHTIAIDTIYLENNESTHFRPIVDSLQVGAVLLRRVARFMLSSGVSCVIDISLCWILLALLQGCISSDLLRIGLAVTLARVVSMVVNYTLNKVFVFSAKTAKVHAFERYVLLAIGNMVAATLFIYMAQLCLQMDEYTAKIVADTILFIINYQVQRVWVFQNAGGAK